MIFVRYFIDDFTDYSMINIISFVYWTRKRNHDRNNPELDYFLNNDLFPIRNLFSKQLQLHLENEDLYPIWIKNLPLHSTKIWHFCTYLLICFLRISFLEWVLWLYYLIIVVFFQKHHTLFWICKFPSSLMIRFNSQFLNLITVFEDFKAQNVESYD
jgi:hypothetical protein